AEPGAQRFGGRLARGGRGQLRKAERRAPQHVAAGALLDELAVFEQLDLEASEPLGKSGNGVRLDRARLADNQRAVKTEGGDEIDRLKFPVGKGAIDDLEAERKPFDRGQRGVRVEGWSFGPANRRLHLEHNLRLDLRRESMWKWQPRDLTRSELGVDSESGLSKVGVDSDQHIVERVVVHVRPHDGVELQHSP